MRPKNSARKKRISLSKWYHGGLAFSCQGCGNCCSGPDEGYVWISREEIEQEAAYLNLTVAEFKRLYVRRVGARYSLLEKEPNKDCIFLSPNGPNKKCLVYPVRPLQCRTWPFWRENLRSRKGWSNAGQKCPGLNQGQWYDAASIEALRDGDFSRADPGDGIQDAAITWITNHINDRILLKEIEKLYDDIEGHLAGLNLNCENCGKCCDFDRFDHRLYVTTLEILYFWNNLNKQKISFPQDLISDQKFSRCPYQQGQGCLARAFRPSGCRIFFCRDVPSKFQHELMEKCMQRLYVLHDKYEVLYYCADILDWLKNIGPEGKTKS